MSLFSKVGDFLTGGVVDTIADTVEKYFPPDMSEKQKADLKLAIKQLEHNQKIELLKLATEADAEFNDRIKAMEGTAKDLSQFGWLGRIVLFLRGCQRPVWGGLTMWMDVMWFSGKWAGMTQQQESALWLINALVLGFLFGERAIKNVAPFIKMMMESKK